MFYNSRLGLLDNQEIKRLNLFCVKVVKKLSKDNIIICATPYHLSTKTTIEYVNLFYNSGADIVSLIFGEKYYSDEQLYVHFKEIHNQTKSYLLLHQQLLENGRSSNPPVVYYSLKVLKQILSLRKFVAMKEDAKNEIYTKKICKMLKNKGIIITSGSGKKQWIKAKKYGCQSWLSGVSNLDPQIAIDFYKFYKAKNYRYIDMYFRYIEKPFFRLVKKFGWHLVIKACLEINDNFKRYERKPLIKLKHKDFMIVKKEFKKIIINSEKKLEYNYFNFN